MSEVRLKCCTKCGVEKPWTLDFFPGNGGDQIRGTCKPCYALKKAAYDVKYRQANLERIKAYRRQHYVDNKSVYVEHASRRKRGIRGHPVWDAELNDLVLVEARSLVRKRQADCPVDGGWHLEHIVPVKHPNACGLHNAWNIQVVPAKWNMAKSNRSMARFFPIGNPWEKTMAKSRRASRSATHNVPPPHLTTHQTHGKSRPYTTANLSKSPRIGG